jgi:ATP-dependent RNA helicase DDX5/DBP2
MVVLCGLAGSGKTLAYLLPAYAHILSTSSPSATQQQEEGGAAAAAAVEPHVLVLLPSRELALQVHGQCTALFAVTGVSTAVVYGGVPKDQQVRERLIKCWHSKMGGRSSGRSIGRVQCRGQHR